MVYATEHCARSLEEDVRLHLSGGGFVHCDRTLFLVARRVWSGSPRTSIVDPSYTFVGGDQWHVYLGVGDMRRMFDLADEPTPFVSFERNNELRVYSWDDLKKYVHKFYLYREGGEMLQGRRLAKAAACAASTRPV